VDLEEKMKRAAECLQQIIGMAASLYVVLGIVFISIRVMATALAMIVQI
jgi:hypothetical protein